MYHSIKPILLVVLSYRDPWIHPVKYRKSKACIRKGKIDIKPLQTVDGEHIPQVLEAFPVWQLHDPLESQ